MIVSSLSSPSTYFTNNASVLTETPVAVPPDPALPFLTVDDINLEKRLCGENDLAALEADPNELRRLTWVNQARSTGAIVGDLADVTPGGHLTNSDIAFFEKMTGTATVQAALESSFDARGLMLQVSDSRQFGTLTGDLTANFFSSYLEISQDAYAHFKIPGLASPSFVKEVIAELEAMAKDGSSSKIDKTA